LEQSVVGAPGVVAVSPLNGKLVPVVLVATHAVRLITPLPVAGALTLIGEIVSAPVGRTSPTPLVQMSEPWNERTSIVPPWPKPPDWTSSPDASSWAVSRLISEPPWTMMWPPHDPAAGRSAENALPVAVTRLFAITVTVLNV
jgi:hypothetical protein